MSKHGLHTWDCVGSLINIAVLRDMLLARANEAAAALVEPTEPSTPASESTEIIHRLMVFLAAIFWGRTVVRNKFVGLFGDAERTRYSSRCATGHNLRSVSYFFRTIKGF